METVVLVIHLLLAVALIAVILLQRSEGGGLGMGTGGGSAGGFGGMMSARGAANFLTRTTAVLAASFMATSLLLAILSTSQKNDNLLDKIEGAEVFTNSESPAAPATEAGTDAPEQPVAEPEQGEPQVPLAE
jgi:preprotein translocase subunit SecG